MNESAKTYLARAPEQSQSTSLNTGYESTSIGMVNTLSRLTVVWFGHEGLKHEGWMTLVNSVYRSAAGTVVFACFSATAFILLSPVSMCLPNSRCMLKNTPTSFMANRFEACMLHVTLVLAA